MVSRFDLLVFDWDGTLMDSAAAIVASIQRACRDLGVPEPSDALARHVIGLGLGDAIRHAVPALEERDYPRLAERYRHHYLSIDRDLRLFPGIELMIEELAEAGFMLAVATGKSRMGLDRALAASGLGRHFHGSRCADECRSKPDPEMLEALMKEFGAVPERTLMIGDTIHDLQMARNARVPALGVGYGAHPSDQLDSHGPLAVFDRVEELAEWLRKNA